MDVHRRNASRRRRPAAAIVCLVACALAGCGPLASEPGASFVAPKAGWQDEWEFVACRLRNHGADHHLSGGFYRSAGDDPGGRVQVRHLLQTLRQAGGTSRTPNLGRNRWTSFANLWGAAGQVQREALVEVAGERTLLKRKQPGYVLRLRVVAADEQSATIRAAVWAYDTEGGREAERFLIVEDRQVPLNDEFILLDRSQLESPSPTAGPAPPATRPAGR